MKQMELHGRGAAILRNAYKMVFFAFPFLNTVTISSLRITVVMHKSSLRPIFHRIRCNVSLRKMAIHLIVMSVRAGVM